MTTQTCTRRVSAPAYYLGRPAGAWIIARYLPAPWGLPGSGQTFPSARKAR